MSPKPVVEPGTGPPPVYTPTSRASAPPVEAPPEYIDHSASSYNPQVPIYNQQQPAYNTLQQTYNPQQPAYNPLQQTFNPQSGYPIQQPYQIPYQAQHTYPIRQNHHKIIQEQPDHYDYNRESERSNNTEMLECCGGIMAALACCCLLQGMR